MTHLIEVGPGQYINPEAIDYVLKAPRSSITHIFLRSGKQVGCRISIESLVRLLSDEPSE